MTSKQSESRIPQQSFLFDSLGSKMPRSSRKIHIRRLVDVMQISIHRHDWPRARRAWVILARCKEFEWKSMWKTGLLLAGPVDDTADLADEEGNPQRLGYLRVMMLRSPENRVPILQEIILRLIMSNRYQHALDELELYLPSSPYQDNPVLHIYAGLIRLYMAQSSGTLLPENSNYQNQAPGLHSIDQGYVRESRSHFQRALEMDPENLVASEFIARLETPSLVEGSDVGNDSEDLDDIEFEPHNNALEKRPHKKTRKGRTLTDT